MTGPEYTPETTPGYWRIFFWNAQASAASCNTLIQGELDETRQEFA